MKNKIIFLLFIAIFLLSSPEVVKAKTVYFFEVLVGGAPIEIPSFEKKDICETERLARKTLYKDQTNYPDHSVSSSCEEKEVKEPSKEVVDVTAKENQPIGKYKSTYTLLAPIGDFKEFKTDDIGRYLNILVKLAIGLCGALAVIMIIINGVMYMGEGSIFKKAQAKDGITDAIIGLLIALGSWAILNTINPDLLGGSGLSIRVAKLEFGDVDAPSSIDSTATTIGINCPKSGGINAIPEIAKSFNKNMTYSQDIPKGKVVNNKIKQDCSGFANAVLICAGIKPKINSGTYGMFSSSYSEKIVSIDTGTNSINGIPLKNGDLIGWRAKDNPGTKHADYGHVFVYIGNGRMADSHGGTKEGDAYGEFTFPGSYKDYLKYIIRVP